MVRLKLFWTFRDKYPLKQTWNALREYLLLADSPDLNACHSSDLNACLRTLDEQGILYHFEFEEAHEGTTVNQVFFYLVMSKNDLVLVKLFYPMIDTIEWLYS